MVQAKRYLARSLATSFSLAALLLCCSAAAAEDALTLGQAIELGRRRAPEIRAARADADSESAQYSVAKAGYLPSGTLALVGQLQTGLTTQPLPPPAKGLFPFVSYTGAAQGTVNLQWTIWDFGKTLNAVRNADAQRINAILTVAATDLTVLASVANAYMSLVYGEKLRDVARATVSEREKLVAIAKGLVEAGLQPPLDGFRAEARAEASRRDLASAEANALDARAVLAALLGLNPEAPLHVTMPRLRPLALDAAAAMREASQLPAVRALDATVAQYEAAVGTARAQYLPTIGFGGSASYNLTKYNAIPDVETTRGATAALTVSAPLFNFGLAPAVDTQRANVENARWNAEVARRNAREEAARARVALTAAQAILDHAHLAAVGASGVLSVVQARYIKGLSSPLELIQAESDDDAARLIEAQDELNFALQTVRLYVDVGHEIE